MMQLWILAAAAFIVLVLYFRQIYSRFSRYGVKNLTPIPIFGNSFRMLLKKEHFTESFSRMYRAFPNERFVGTFEFATPVVVIRDPELVKMVTIKDFEQFLEHRFNFDTLFDKSLLTLKGQDWKDMRSSLSPAFTSSKMRLMVPFMAEVGEQMIRSLKNKMLDDGNNYIDINVRDLTTRFANDVIATCAFGLNVNSHTDENNQFYTMAKAIVTFDLNQLIALLLNSSILKILKALKITTTKSEKAKSFFDNLVLNTIKEREKSCIIRPDMIHLLMEAKKGKLKQEEKSIKDPNTGFATVGESAFGKNQVDRVWTDSEIISQALVFLAAGFDSVSNAMMFLLHELALNPDVQEKLYQEIKETDAKNGGNFGFESIIQMEYMDMVVSEVLRLWPPGVILERLCIKDYNLGRPNDKATKDYVIHKGEGIEIPVWAIHRDPHYFPDPFKFDPERFSKENRDKIKPFTYIPFGLGPRNCIGSRFALCEVKIMAYQLLQSMEVSANSMTQASRNELSIETFGLRLKHDHWARLRLRN